MKDEEYRERFTKCVMAHYKNNYEIYVMDDIDDVWDKKISYDIVLIDEGVKLNKENGKEQIVFLLTKEDAPTDDNVCSEDKIFCTEKFQEVYKIIEKIEKVMTKKGMKKNGRNKKANAELLGVFSLEKEKMQIPFTALLGEILGERNKVLVVDLQPFSGMSMEVEIDDVLGMEDMLSVSMTENYTKSRLSGSIGHEAKWDFIYPVKNSSCLMEANSQIYEKMIEIVEKELGYEQIILNFGSAFSGMEDLMEKCEQFYILTDQKEDHSWRESAFLTELRELGKERFLEQIIWIEIHPEFIKEHSWKQLERSWLWSHLGDQIRKISWVEKKDG